MNGEKEGHGLRNVFINKKQSPIRKRFSKGNGVILF